MQLKTLLNRVHKCKGFVYQDISLVGHDGLELLVQVAPRKRTRPTCSVCGRRAVHYDTLKRRRFQFVPLWGIAVFFVYAMRRVKCPRCGVKVEKVPWAESKSPMTTSYAWFLSHWATKLSWQETAKSFGTSCEAAPLFRTPNSTGNRIWAREGIQANDTAKHLSRVQYGS